MSSATVEIVLSLVRELFLEDDESFPLEPDLDLVEGGICDSMGLVQLASMLEQRFEGLEIQDQDVTRETMGSVGAICALVDRGRA